MDDRYKSGADSPLSVGRLIADRGSYLRQERGGFFVLPRGERFHDARGFLPGVGLGVRYRLRFSHREGLGCVRSSRKHPIHSAGLSASFRPRRAFLALFGGGGGVCTVQGVVAPVRRAGGRWGAPSGVLFQDLPQLDRQGLPTCERHRHISHEPLNVAG